MTGKPSSWWEQMSNNRVLVVSAMIALSQGLNSLNDLSISYLYKDDYHFSPALVSALSSFVVLPWILKPFWGLISDNIPFLGYKRKSYIILLAFIGFMAHLTLSSWAQDPNLGVSMIFSISFSIAFYNVIGEALLVESAQKFGALPGTTEEDKQNQASHNVSLFFGVKYVGSIIASYFGGFLLEYITKNEVFKISSIVPMTVGLVALTLPESRILPKREQQLESSPTTDDEISPLAPSQEVEARAADTEASPFVKIWTFVKQPEIFKPLVFLFIFQITPSTGSATFYFYTNELKFTPEFMGRINLAGSIAVLFGIFLYNKFLKNVHFTKLLMWSSLICFALNLTMLLVITRANVALGIPDRLFCLSDSVVINVFSEINSIPILVLACRMCPKNIEGTMYALFISILNFGGIVSTQLGALLIWALGIDQTDFSNLWLAVVISSMFLLFPLPWLTRVRFDVAIERTEEKNHTQHQERAKEEEEELIVDIEFKEAALKS